MLRWKQREQVSEDAVSLLLLVKYETSLNDLQRHRSEPALAAAERALLIEGLPEVSRARTGAMQSRAAAQPQEFEPVPLAELEKRHIYAMLDYASGNKTKASQLLGIERSTLDRKLKRYNQ